MGDLRTTAALCCIVSIATFASTMMLRRLCAVGGATARRGVASASAAACCQGCCSAPISSVRTETTVVGNAVEQALRPEVRHLHAQAVAEGKDTYIDPDTGLTVLTRLSHLRRGDCCGSRCRHCPYNHKNVPGAAVPKTVPAPPKPVAAAGESVKHSVVYTKGGDKGSSSLFTGERRKKTDVVFEALGAIDELSSHVGLARALLREGGAKGAEAVALLALLEDIQQQLLNAGTVVATPAAGVEATPGSMASLLDTYKFPDKTLELEKVIDVTDSRLVPLRIFILPGGGNASSAQLHVCRTTCRRAERRMIDVRDAYGPQYTDHLRQASVYVNRLSDFFFVAARSVAEEDIVRKYD